MIIGRCNVVTDQQGRECKAHGSVRFPVACYGNDLSIGPVLWHWHDELEFIAIVSGEADVCVDGESYTLTEGAGIFINAGRVHGVQEHGPAGCILHSVVFHPRLVGGSFDSIFWQDYLQPLLADTACRSVCFSSGTDWEREAVCTIQRIWDIFVSQPQGFEFQLRAMASQLVFLLTAHRPRPPQSPSTRKLRSEERIKTMLQYIQEHYAEALCTAQIARSAMVSESECLRCFRTMTGTTPIQYLKQFRLQKAAELLAHTDWKVAEIGTRCGFQDMSYFAKLFRAAHGCPPGAYRNSRVSGDTGSPPVLPSPE